MKLLQSALTILPLTGAGEKRTAIITGAANTNKNNKALW